MCNVASNIDLPIEIQLFVSIVYIWDSLTDLYTCHDTEQDLDYKCQTLQGFRLDLFYIRKMLFCQLALQKRFQFSSPQRIPFLVPFWFLFWCLFGSFLVQIRFILGSFLYFSSFIFWFISGLFWSVMFRSF